MATAMWFMLGVATGSFTACALYTYLEDSH